MYSLFMIKHTMKLNNTRNFSFLKHTHYRRIVINNSPCGKTVAGWNIWLISRFTMGNNHTASIIDWFSQNKHILTVVNWFIDIIIINQLNRLQQDLHYKIDFNRIQSTKYSKLTIWYSRTGVHCFLQHRQQIEAFSTRAGFIMESMHYFHVI